MTIAELEREIGHVKTRADVLETENVILKERNRVLKEERDKACARIAELIAERDGLRELLLSAINVTVSKLQVENAALWKALEEKP